MDKQTEYGYNWWLARLDEAEKRLRDDWWKDADQIIKKYKAKKGAGPTSARLYWMNIFWANVGVLKAALYARRPKPMVNRVWEDQNDSIGRVASLMLERLLAYDFLKNNSPMDQAIKLAVEDRLIPGLGCIWLRYAVETETVSVPGNPGGDPVEFEVISQEEVECEYVHWRDVVYPAARTWDEVWFVARKCYMEPEKAKEVLGKSVDRQEDANVTDQDKVLPKNFGKGMVTVYEIWCKRSNKVYWVSRDVPNACREKEDFLHLDDFYPCPRFLMATHATDDYLPRADFTMVKDQYDQLTELNSRITILEKALRVVGVYDSKNNEVKRILSDARENEMIPVEKWAVLAESGGLKGVVDWFPVEVIAEVLEKLQVQMQAKIQQIYELTGIADIMRGSTNPRETLGAQELKSQYASVRLQYIQGDVSEFVRAALIIKAELITTHFQDETIFKITNIMNTPDAQYAQAALQMLRDSEMTEYRVDINEEGLALPDYNQEKQTRIEFLSTVGQFLSQAAPITEAIPGALPYLVQMIKWVAASLRGSNEIQGVLDQAIAAMQQNPPQKQAEGQEAPEDVVGAEVVKQKGEAQREMLKGKIKQGEITLTKNLELRNDMVKSKAEHQQEAHLQAQGAQQDAGIEQIKANNQKSQVLTQAMVAQEHAQHEFQHASEQSDRDHQHQLQQIKAAPRPTQGK
jgi:hypothetical protein